MHSEHDFSNNLPLKISKVRFSHYLDEKKEIALLTYFCIPFTYKS